MYIYIHIYIHIYYTYIWWSILIIPELWRVWKKGKTLVLCNEKLRPLEGLAQESPVRTEIAQMMDQVMPRWDMHKQE